MIIPNLRRVYRTIDLNERYDGGFPGENLLRHLIDALCEDHGLYASLKAYLPSKPRPDFKVYFLSRTAFTAATAFLTPSIWTVEDEQDVDESEVQEIRL